MWPTLITLWLVLSGQTPQRPAPRRRPAFRRPLLEALEDRTAPAVFLVTKTLDDGSSGSLRWAINQVNADTDPLSTIAFDIASSGMHTIYLSAALPPINNPVVIDGTTEPGSQANSLPLTGATAGDNTVWTITLDGSLIGSNSDGLAIAAGGSTVQGLVIQNFSNGIHLTTNGNDLIAGNYLAQGVFVDNVPNNTIGGTTPGARNISDGPQIQGAGATGNHVQGDYISTDGSQRIAGSQGVVIFDASNNVVGGTAPGAGNVIAGGRGILIGGDSSTPVSGNFVQGNYIGTNAAGTAFPTEPAGDFGVWLAGNVSNNTIGGLDTNAPGDPLTGAGNVISGWPIDVIISPVAGFTPTGNMVAGNYIGTNAAGCAALVPNFGTPNGILVQGTNTTISGNLISGVLRAVVLDSNGCQVQGNLIGTDATGTLPIANGEVGVGVESSNDLIGGTTPGAGNTIAFNDGPAVSVGGTGVQIEGNSIYGNNDINGNTGPAIDNLDQVYRNLGTTLIDTNVPGGPFTGTNTASFSGLMLTQTGSTLTYSGTLNGLNNTRYQVTVDANSPGAYWGSDYTFLTTDPTGQVTFTISFAAPSGFPNTQGSLPASATANPPHSQGNYEQNYPVLAAAQSSSTSTSISGSLNSAANTQYTVDFYANQAADPSGYGQGQTYLGSTTVTTDANGIDGSGNVTFTADLAVGNLAAQWITATATDPNGNTSEFGLDVQATAAPSQTYAQYLQGALPQSSTAGNSMTIQASAGTTPATVIPAVNGLTNVTEPVTIILDLGGGTYSSGGNSADSPPNVIFEIINGTLDPAVPALTVAGGRVSVINCTLTTSGDAPTLLVTGGNVTLLNDHLVQASASFTDPAISVTGGTVNLGTATTPGNNTLSVNGSGDLVSNTTGNAISAVGDTFEVGGTVETARHPSASPASPPVPRAPSPARRQTSRPR